MYADTQRLHIPLYALALRLFSWFVLGPLVPIKRYLSAIQRHLSFQLSVWPFPCSNMKMHKAGVMRKRPPQYGEEEHELENACKLWP